MQLIGWLMIALFVWLFHGPWLAYKRAVDGQDWPTAGANLNRIRQIIAINLPLGRNFTAPGRTVATTIDNEATLPRTMGAHAR